MENMNSSVVKVSDLGSKESAGSILVQLLLLLVVVVFSFLSNWELN